MIHSLTTIASKIYLAMTFCIVTFVLSMGASAHADQYSRIDNKAKKIQKKSKRLLKETADYRHTSQYASLVDATARLHDTAIHIQQVAYLANNLNHLQTDLASLDHCFHQLESLFAAAEDAASRGHVQIHGNTASARSLLRSIEVRIDQMRKDVRKLQSRAIAQHHKAYPAATPVVTYHAAGNDRSYARDRPVVNQRAVQQQVIQNRGPAKTKAVKQQRPVHQQPRQTNGISFSIGSRSPKLQFNF